MMIIMSRAAVVTITVLLVAPNLVRAPPPVRLTIDCSKGDTDCKFARKAVDLRDQRFNPRSVCNLFQNAIPKAVRDGKFVLIDNDQAGDYNTQISQIIPPPLKRFRPPRVKIPKFAVPKLKASGTLSAPRIGSSMFRSDSVEEQIDDSSAERMEKFKKGVQKMLYVVKVLGQIDQYLSERTRIVVDALAKLVAD